MQPQLMHRPSFVPTPKIQGVGDMVLVLGLLRFHAPDRIMCSLIPASWGGAGCPSKMIHVIVMSQVKQHSAGSEQINQ